MKNINTLSNSWMRLLILIAGPMHTVQAAAPLQAEKAILQTALGLVCVVGFIFMLVWLNKRMGGIVSGAHNIIKVLGVVPVGTKEKVVLVEVGGKQILLGVTQHQINTLSEHLVAKIEKPVVRELKKRAPINDLAASTPNEFSQKLREFLYSGKKL
jgi:flagellar biosynthetic protein FliO